LNAVRLESRKRFHRCHFCCKVNAGEVLVAKEGAVVGICGFGKTFDRVPHVLQWWGLRLKEWIEHVVESMYAGVNVESMYAWVNVESRYAWLDSSEIKECG